MINQNLLKNIDLMLVECEQKAVLYKQLNHKSGFLSFFDCVP